MNNILLIDESSLFRKFVTFQLEYYGFTVSNARSGFDGLNKLRTTQPDLVILDDSLNRQSVNGFLKKKSEDINLKRIPIIFLAKVFSQERIVELCRVQSRRFLLKPLKIDQFYQTVSSFFDSDIYFDQTECQLNMHVNDNIILVEIARGLNKTKLELLHWKIKEIISLNQISNPKIMLLISDVKIDEDTVFILTNLFDSVSAIPNSIKDIKVLTSDKTLKNTINSIATYNEIDVFETLIEAINAFFGKKGLEKLTSNQDIVHKIFLSTHEKYETSGLIDLNYKE